MTITYSWAIRGLKKAPQLGDLSDVITFVDFEYKGVDSESNEHAVFYGMYPLAAPDSENFTPLADLTEAQVLAWVTEGHPVDHMQSRIQEMISEKITPTNVHTEMPWVEPEPVEPEEETPAE